MWLVVGLLLGVWFSSVLEWWLHKYPMHHTFFKHLPSFKNHAIKHHSERQAPGKFFVKKEEHHRYVLFKTSFMPFIWIGLLPVYGMLYRWFGAFGIGFGLGTFVYLIAYEVLHEAMHQPDNFPLKHHWWFRWLIEHHRRHHLWVKTNYNVVLPLADWMFGTLSFRSMPQLEPEHENGLMEPLYPFAS